jgi:hypothetical protein
MDIDEGPIADDTRMDLVDPDESLPIHPASSPPLTASSSQSQLQSGLSMLFHGQQSPDTLGVPATPSISSDGSIPYAQTLVGGGGENSSSSSSASALKRSIPPPEPSFAKRPSGIIPGYIHDAINKTNNKDLPAEVSPREWMQYLYSPQAGTSTPIRKLLQKLDKKGLASEIVAQELAGYDEYELESYTFLQEIIPNLFLGR